MSGDGSFVRGALVAIAILCASAALVLWTAGSSSRMTQGIHGLHHSAYAYQIASGIVPPTNPSSIGAPANFYWGWHALIATTMRTFDITPFEALLLLNVLSLSVLMGALWLATGRWSGSPWRRLGICLLPFFILNPIGISQFAGRATVALGPVVVDSLREGEGIQTPRLQAVMRDRDGLDMHMANSAYLMPRGMDWGVRRSKRTGNLLVKFFGFSSFPSAVALFSLALVTLSVWRSDLLIRCAVLALACMGMALFSPMVVLAFGALVAAHCCVYAHDFARRLQSARREGSALPSLRDPVREWLPALAAGAGVLAALPYLFEISAAFGGETALLLDPKAFLYHARVYGWSLLPSLPIFAAATFLLPRLCPAMRTFWLAGLLMLAATLLVRTPTVDPNEYKLALLSTLPTVLLLLGLLAELDTSGFPSTRGARWLGAGITFALVAAGLLAVAAASLLYLAAPTRDQSPYLYVGTAIDLDVHRARRPTERAERQDLQQAYLWLRENTPPSAYVAELPKPKDDLELSSLAQRRVVAALPSVFTKDIRYQKRLVRETRQMISRLAGCQLRPRELSRLFQVPAPWPDEIYALARLDDNLLPDSPRCRRIWSGAVEVELLNDHYGVFRIDVNEGRRDGSRTRGKVRGRKAR